MTSTAAPPNVDVPTPHLSVRQRLLPRTVLGLAVLILFTSLGAAFSGAVLYAYYQYKLDSTQTDIQKLTAGVQDRFKQAEDVISAQKENAKKEIQDQVAPLRQLAASEQTLSGLVDKLGPSVWFVHTLDQAGQPSVGSAFVVASDADQSFMVTSLAVVRAATRQPGPDVMVKKGDEDLKATLWTWQEERDLALLIVNKANLPKLAWASDKNGVKLGERVFAISGYGGSGAAIVQGQVADVFSEGIQHSAPVGAAFRGGPLVNSNGEVVAVTSADYGPLGYAPGGVTFGVPIQKTCDRILRCPSGNAAGAGGQGDQGAGATPPTTAAKKK